LANPEVAAHSDREAAAQLLEPVLVRGVAVITSGVPRVWYFPRKARVWDAVEGLLFAFARGGAAKTSKNASKNE